MRAISLRMPLSASFRKRPRIRPHHDGDAIGGRTRKITRSQRQIGYGLADADSVLQIMDDADDFVGLLVVSKTLSEGIAISEKSANGRLIQYDGQHCGRSGRTRAGGFDPLVAIEKFPAREHRLA